MLNKKNTLTKSLDIVYLGSCSHDDCKLVALLTEVGKAPLGWRGEFIPEFYLTSQNRDKLPCGITMYDKGELSSQQERLQTLKRTKLIILAGENAHKEAVTEAISHGVLPLVESGSAAARGLADQPQIIFSSSEDLLDKTYHFLSNPPERENLIDLMLQQPGFSPTLAPSSYCCKILYLAFVDETYPQLLNKIDHQFRIIKSLVPESKAVVIGPGFDSVNMASFTIECRRTVRKPGEDGLREDYFRIADEAVESFKPDIIYFRYPFFDLFTLEFVKKHPNVVFELQTIAALEVDEMESFIEQKVAPSVLQYTAGLVAVTPEILNCDINRTRQPLLGFVMSNGINTESLPLSQRPELFDTIHLLCVAYFERWQGYDRLLHGLANYQGTHKIVVHFVGTGPELVKYYELATNLNLEDACVFHGYLDCNQVSQLSEHCHVAIGTLALHRKGMTQFCGLKNREYCLRGIPFVYAGEDIDFPDHLPFVRVVPTGESPLDISPIIELAYHVAAHPEIAQKERQYAIDNLSWEIRIQGLVSFLETICTNLKNSAKPLPTQLTAQPLKQKILFTMYGWNESGGGTTFPRSVALELVRRGYEVGVFYASLKNDPLMPPYSIEKTVEQGVVLYGVYNRPALFTDPDNPEREIHDAGIVEKFQQVLDGFKPSLVHFNNFHGLTFAIAEVVHRSGIPSCFTPHNYHLIDPELYLFNSDLSLWRDADLLKNSEAVRNNPTKMSWYQERITTTRKLLNEWIDITLAVSCRQRELLVQHGGEPDRLIVLHQANRSTDQLWQNKLLAPEASRPLHSPLRVGFIGGVMPQKGVHMLVAAAQLFEPSEVQFHVYGFAMPGYEQELAKIDSRKVITFHGNYSQEQLVDIARELDIAVVPSVWEDCAPLVVLELHAMRLPVIAANIGGIPDFITEGIDGLLYAPFELTSLVDTIRTCLRSPSLVASMRTNLISPSHTFSNYLDQLEKIYSTLFSGQPFDVTQLPLNITPRKPHVAKMIPTISWHGALFVHHSLALVSRELCLQLMDRGFEISYSPTEPDDFTASADSRYSRLEKSRNYPLANIDVTVRHHWPPDFSAPQDGKLVVIQPWEYGSIPTNWVSQINDNVDELWVPSSYVRDCYLQSGVDAGKVRVVPNGVATDCFHPGIPPRKLATHKRFRFLFVGGTIQRKGIDILLAAYSTAFTADDDVCLVIKDMGGNSIYQGQTAHEMIAAFQSVPGHPELLYLEEMLDTDRMAALYTACHCLVHPYRGEGFGLPIAEAMACGLAPIVTGYGAALDFCPPEIAWLIPAVVKPLATKQVGNLETVDFPWLAEPDSDALTSILRHAFSHPDEVEKRGIAASHFIQENFTWTNAAGIAEKRLRSLVRQPDGSGEANSVSACSVQVQDSKLDKATTTKISGMKGEVTVDNQLVRLVCLKAEKLAQQGDVDAAVELLLNEGIRADSASLPPYLALAEILMAAGRFQDALGVASEMPAEADKLVIHEIEAQCFCALGDDISARKAATLAGDQRPQALVVLGTLAARQGDPLQGEQLFRQAIAVDSNCGKAWLSLGMILWSQGKQQDGWQAVRRAVEIDPLNNHAVRIFRDMAGRMA